MPVSLPERTVDAWVTAYVAKRVPDALLWAPTQQQIPDYDIASSLPGPGKLFVFEDKAPYTNGAHHFDLPVRQIWNYLRRDDLKTRTFYVLPCPPFPVVDVPGGPGAAAAPTPDLVPHRAQFRYACEDWFRVVPVMDLWARLSAGTPPTDADPFWPKPKWGHAPSGAPAKQNLPLTCPLPSDLGESLKTFMDRLLKCDRPELRVYPERVGDVARVTDDAQDSPLYQALIAFAPASNLPGWTD
jgi:hypothetical protein